MQVSHDLSFKLEDDSKVRKMKQQFCGYSTCVEFISLFSPICDISFLFHLFSIFYFLNYCY